MSPNDVSQPDLIVAGALSAAGELSADLTDVTASDFTRQLFTTESLWTPGPEPDLDLDLGISSLTVWRAPDLDVVNTLNFDLGIALADLIPDDTQVTVRLTVSTRTDLDALNRMSSMGVDVAGHIHHDASGSPGWHWPLRVAVLDGPGASERYQELTTSQWHSTLYTVEHITIDDESEFDVLIVGNTADARASRAQASSIFVNGPNQEAAEQTLEDLAPLSAGALVVTNSDDASWFSDVVFELSHDTPLDVAVAHSIPDAVMAADGSFLGLTSIRRWTQQAVADLRRNGDTASAQRLEALLPHAFDHETNGATAVAAEVSAIEESTGRPIQVRVEPLAMAEPDIDVDADADADADGVGLEPPRMATPERSAPGAGRPPMAASDDGAAGTDTGHTPEPGGDSTGPAPRQLQADVLVGTRRLDNALIAGEEHTIEISVGHLGSVRSRTPFPEPTMSDTDDFVMLTVHWWCGNDTATDSLRLPKDTRRESSAASFSLTPAAGIDHVRAVVAVYSGTAFLQGAVFEADVVDSMDTEATHPPSRSLLVETWVRDLRPADVDPRTVTVYTPGSGAAALATGPSGSFGADLGALHTTLRGLTERVEHGAEDMLADEQEFDRVIYDLARNGAVLHASLRNQLGADVCDSPRLAVISASGATVLPLELVYDGPSPMVGARACAGWTEALASGICQGCAQPTGTDHGDADHGDAAPAVRETDSICPLGFWGVSKVIERHRGAEGGAATYTVSAERRPELGRLRSFEAAVVGTSRRLTADQSAAVVTLVQHAVAGTVPADSWDAWRAGIGTARDPALLIAVPHLASDDSAEPAIDALELGDSLLPLDKVHTDVIATAPRTPGPAVVLLGCGTANDETPIESFATMFLGVGAAVVVSTLGTILVADAVAAVPIILSCLGAPQDPQATLGRVMLETRRALLAQRNLIAFLLVALGDADWLLPEGAQ